MLAAQCTSLEGPSSIRVVDVPPPALGPRDVRVAVSYAAVNFMDLLIVAGQYQYKPQLPFVPGHDAAGTVIEVGSEVVGISPGARVSVGVSYGAFAEQIVAPQARIVELPDGVDFRMGAAYRASYCTALYALENRGSLKPGETLVVTGAAGGVGLATVQIARVLGAKTIGIVGSLTKASCVTAEGATAIVLDDSCKLRNEILHQCPDGFDVALDTVGGPRLIDLLGAAAWDSRILVVGFTAGIPAIPANRLLLRSASVVGVNYGAWQDKDNAATLRIHTTVLNWISKKRILPRIAAEYPLSQTEEALRALALRESIGKLLIRI